MITNPNLIYYASVSKGTTVVAEFNSKDADLAALAGKCLQNAPQHHTTFTHTIRKRTYTFLIDDPFVYFAINDENLENSETLLFLRSVKEAFHGIGVVPGEELTSHCYQGEFSPIFHKLLTPADMDGPQSPPGGSSTHSRNGSLDSPRGKRIGSMPLLGGGDQSKALKKKRRHSVEGNGHGRDGASPEDKSNSSNDGGGGGGGLTREFSVSMQKGNGLFAGDVSNQRAKKVWKKHVWVVLSLDLIVCCILFAIWLWVCRGFKCIDE